MKKRKTSVAVYTEKFKEGDIEGKAIGVLSALIS